MSERTPLACVGAPAAAPVRAIDSGLSSTGQFGSQRRGHEGNRRPQLALWPPALISTPIRKGGKRPWTHLVRKWTLLPVCAPGLTDLSDGRTLDGDAIHVCVCGVGGCHTPTVWTTQAATFSPLKDEGEDDPLQPHSDTTWDRRALLSSSEVKSQTHFMTRCLSNEPHFLSRKQAASPADFRCFLSPAPAD